MKFQNKSEEIANKMLKSLKAKRLTNLKTSENNKPFHFFENTIFIHDLPLLRQNDKKYKPRDPNKYIADKIIKSVLKK